MKIVVSDTSPISTLVRLHCEYVLPLLFERVLIPPEITQELRHPRSPASIHAFLDSGPSWLVEQTAIQPKQDYGLHAGETAAITLALELSVPLLIDEADGRRTALRLGLEVIGTLGILNRAADAGFIQDLADIHQRIRLGKFHIPENLLEAALELHLSQPASRMQG